MYVYILRSLQEPLQVYIGLTTDLKRRLQEHNGGHATYTRRFRPWKVETALWFSDDKKAVLFEGYLKTHSGAAFRSKHF